MIDTSISVFLPALNEEENIKSCIFSATRYLRKRFKDYEILVIASGSTDRTEDIVLNLARKDPHIKLISNKEVLGYGTALRSGFANASKELIFYTDSDNQFNIEDLDLLLPLLDRYDIVSGYRINRQDPPMRIFIAHVYNLMMRILFHCSIRDIDASFKLYKRKVFQNMQLRANTGLVDAEVLIKAKKNGFSIGQVGVRHYPRIKGTAIYGVGKRNTFVRPSVVIKILAEMKKLWSDLR